MNAGVTCRRSLVRSQPCAPGRVPPAGQETGLSIRQHGFDSRTRRKAMRLRLLMDQDLRVRISGWRFESARSHEDTGCDPGSGWFPTPASGVRLLGGLPARQAAHLAVRSVSYAE